MRWFLLLVAATFAELVVLWRFGSLVGFWPTIALIVATGVLGAAMAKREGLRVWAEWRSGLERGAVPAVGLVDGLLVLLGGLLLLAPGLLGDLVGLVLLVPPTRRFVATFVRTRLEARFGRVAEGVDAEAVGAASDAMGASFGSFTVIQTGGSGGFPGNAFGDRYRADPFRRDGEDRRIVVIETTGEAVDEDPKPKLLLPPAT